MKKLLITAGLLTGIAYNLFWWGFLLLPFTQMVRGNVPYSALVLDPLFVPVNLFQVIGIVSLFIFFLVFYKRYYDDTIISTVFVILFIIGACTFSGIAFYETFIVPVIASKTPEIINHGAGTISSSFSYLVSVIIGATLFTIGHVHIGIITMKKIHRFSGVLYAASWVIFYLGYLSGPARYAVQSAGMVLIGISYTFVSIQISKDAA